MGISKNPNIQCDTAPATKCCGSDSAKFTVQTAIFAKNYAYSTKKNILLKFDLGNWSLLLYGVLFLVNLVPHAP
jgi:hypothetical protein